MTTQEVMLDSRRRTSLAKVGNRGDSRYLAETFPDGRIVLTPATLVTQHELRLLANPDFVRALETAQREPGKTVTRKRPKGI